MSGPFPRLRKLRPIEVGVEVVYTDVRWLVAPHAPWWRPWRRYTRARRGVFWEAAPDLGWYFIRDGAFIECGFQRALELAIAEQGCLRQIDGWAGVVLLDWTFEASVP